MADPEQIYQEVLQEEQQKGSAAPVAEGRAKAARVRAEHGSPHPKEPRWWPGAQPHLEGGEAAAEEPEGEAAEPAAEAPAEEPAAAEAPAAEAPPAAEPAPGAPAPAAQPPSAQPAEAPAAAATAQPAAAPSEAAAATAPVPVAASAAPAGAPTEAAPVQRPSGVTHGTTTGTRLRPEDAVSTDAQFEAQQAHYDRRKLIDELVGTGVPRVSAAQAGSERSPFLAILYLLIPVIAVAFLLSQRDTTTAEPAPPPADGGSGGLTLVADNVQFDKDELSAPAGEEVTVTLDNQDSVDHNFAVYESEAAEEEIFSGDVIGGGQNTENTFEVPEKGEYFFRCDLHPTDMVGTFVAE